MMTKHATIMTPPEKVPTAKYGAAKKKLNLSKYSEVQLKRYMEHLFKIGDKDGNGTLDKAELAALLGWSGFKFDVTSVEQLIATCDKNGDGVIEYAEFVDLMLHHCRIDDSASASVVRKPASESSMQKPRKKLDVTKYSEVQLKRYMEHLFKIGDKDGNGTLDKAELAALLGWSGFKFDLTSVEQLIATCDKNGDGVIEYAEFVDLMLHHCRIDDSASASVVRKPASESSMQKLRKKSDNSITAARPL